MYLQHSKPWPENAVIYQVYPRSFYDSNNDGIGDLKGITQKLDYIASLGVDGIWISPFFMSPMKDFGYDVSDYCAVDPIFGTLEDFHELIHEAHKRDLKIMIDQVLSHTSDEHAWFSESKQNKSNPKKNWYVWADAKEDGSPPNNWLSVFGGSAWEWEESRGQYYLHNFLTQQPDLNFHEPQVIKTLESVLSFWLDRGVDGFRLDAANFYLHDRLLRDNPIRKNGEPGAEGVPADNPYSRQHHIYDKSQPENLIILRHIRSIMDRYPNILTIGEVGDDNSTETSVAYCEHLNHVYSFKLLELPFQDRLIQETIEAFEKAFSKNTPCYSFSNHDVVRAITRWGKEYPEKNFAKLLITMLLTLRATVFIYQGEELGLSESDIPFEKIQDPYGKEFYPKFKGRDGCRTPLPWKQDQANAGFSKSEPWLPVDENHYTKAIEQQTSEALSLLNYYRELIHWRKKQPALQKGDLQFLDSSEGALVYVRRNEEQILLIILNLSPPSPLPSNATFIFESIICDRSLSPVTT